ncbi:MAG: methyltransferase domain-containing protein [Thiohalomonadales bacterium]
MATHINSESIIETAACPVCGSINQQTLYRHNKQTGTTLGEIEVVVGQCDDCGFVYNSRRLRSAVISDYYFSSSVASGQTYRDEDSQAYYPSLHKTRARFLSGFLNSQLSGSLLDIGCGVGGFLGAMSHELNGDWQCLGIEPSMEASRLARINGFRVKTTMLAGDIFTPHSIDAISLVSVLEHLSDLHQALKSVTELLKSDGIVFIEVPNLLLPELSLTGFFSPEHIQHFTPGSLFALLHRYGLSEIITDRSVTDKVIRIVASARMAGWSTADLVTYSDDSTEACQAVKEYTTREERLLTELNYNVTAALVRWQRRNCTIAIYGAGVHTAELLGHFDLHAVCSIVIDGDPKKQGTTYLGFPVYSPEQILELGINAILISSHRFQDEIINKIRQVAGERVEIALCYE